MTSDCTCLIRGNQGDDFVGNEDFPLRITDPWCPMHKVYWFEYVTKPEQETD